MSAEPAACAPQTQVTEAQAAAETRKSPEASGPDAAGRDPSGNDQSGKDSSSSDPSGSRSSSSDSASPSDLSLFGLGKDILHDQQRIWTSPARLRFSDTEWLVPFAGISAGLFVTDRDVSLHLSHNPSTLSHYNTLSNAGVGALVGGAAGLWLLSFPSHNSHWRETGLLAGEAAINSLIPAEISKYGLGRDRPLQGDGGGHFFQGGTSFPSEHSVAAWAVAGVIAHEYPGPIPKLLAYGMASLVSYSRIRAEQHFSSDVFVGSILGSLIAQEVYSHHHDPDLGGEDWNSIGDVFRAGSSNPANQGTPYVPLDSWVYPALDRLAGLHLVDSEFVGMRPWTRRECARLVTEAGDHLTDDNPNSNDAQEIVSQLEREFQPEIDGTEQGIFRVESLYSRAEYISGSPINDGYHFAQTQINDFGRPFGRGWNTATGFSAYATEGRWVSYFRGEWQTSGGLPALSLAARETIQQVDHIGQLPPGLPQPSVDQFTVLDAYVGLMFSNWQVTFGRQSLWWGPGDGGPMMLSDDAVPLNMFRINRVTPLKLPSVLGWLGPLRVEFFLGQLSGQQFMNVHGIMGSFQHTLHPQPMINGERFTFKPTPNFEFGFSRTTIFAGESVPFTLGSFKNSLFSLSRSAVNDPGDRRSGMDWSYRLPMLRDWVTFYGDAFADDQISPIAYLDRSAIRAGLYFSHLPRISKLDFRVEGVYTDLPAGGALSHGFFYSNDRYLNGYTSNGQLMGSWIGREGQGAQAWTNYWFSPRNRLQFNFRHQKVSQQFIPGGGSLTDVGVRSDYWLRPSIGLSGWVQYERWMFPIIQPNAARNTTVGVEVQFQPQKWFQRSATNAADNGFGSGGRP